jgi:peptidoglycan/LPS O-acetylase OafA/YrhL
MSKNRLKGLDGMRGIAVLLVVIYHVGEFLGPEYSAYQPYILALNHGVTIFFVLSGLLITWLFLNEEKKYENISLKNFYIRRTMRILPAVILYLGVMAILKVADFEGYTIESSWYQFASAAFFLKNMVYPVGMEVGHFWSLAIEEHFYLIWPLILIFLKGTKPRLILLCTIVCLAPFWRHANLVMFGAEMVNWKRTDIRIDPIIYGCILALFRETKAINILRSPFFKSPLLMCICIFFIIVPYVLRHNFPGFINLFIPSLQFLSAALMLNVIIETNSNVINKVLASKVLVFFGHISFSLYLWQQYFCYALPTTWDKIFPANAIFAIICASISYYLVEKPILNYRHRNGLGSRE